MTSVKKLLRSITGLDALRPLRMLYIRHCVLPPIHKRYAGLDAAAVFSDVYASKQWGDEKDQTFTSGTGSGDTYTNRYCELVTSFILKHKVQTVVDIGCGDFRVGRKIAGPEILYTGVDVVQDLITYNEKAFGTDLVRFQRGDLTTGVLPDADLCLIRQVLQHLSNEEIVVALQRCRRYRYTIITEHVPTGSRIRPNLNKPHGPDTRLYSNSGVFLDQPPFFQKITTLLDVPADKWSVLRSCLIEHSK
jgi:SAM-dependent methyltransferase